MKKERLFIYLLDLIVFIIIIYFGNTYNLNNTIIKRNIIFKNLSRVGGTYHPPQICHLLSRNLKDFYFYLFV